MLRLQLLPDHVFEGARIKKAVILCTLVFLLDAAICFLWFSSQKAAMVSMTQQSEVAAGFQSQISALDGEIGALQALIAPVDSKRDYILALKDYGDNWPQRMRALAMFIYARVEVLNCQLDQQGFELQVRTKTTEDVARLLMNLKQGYAAGLLQQDSLNVTGLNGWPNMTSPLGISVDTASHLDPGVGLENGALQGVNSGSNPAAPAQQGGAGGMEGSGSEAMPDESSGSGGMSGEPGMEGGSGGGFGGAAGARAGTVDSALMRLLAIRKYIQPSVDPPPQPYLNLTVTGRWQVPLQSPTGNAPAGAAGAAPPGGDMGSGSGDVIMEGPPADDGGSAAPAE